MATADDDVRSELASIAMHLARRKSEVGKLIERVQEEWAERAAIREYLGALPRWCAEREAVQDAGEMLGVRCWPWPSRSRCPARSKRRRRGWPG